jgi:hypothetical protein
MPWLLLLAAVLLAGALYFARRLYRRGLDRWLVPYLVQAPKRRLPAADEEIHVLLCFADHYEPRAGGASPAVARSRVERWVGDYPRQFGRFRDSDGRPPRYTFFYPIEEYEAEHLDLLAGLCRAGFGEVELHLHHHNDTAANFREQLLTFRALLAERHGMLARRRATGELAYGFIHGNWALCNSHPGGINCGVNNELHILRETGCYADFTMPSAPHRTQTRKINSLYYARDKPGRAWSHDSGRDVGAGPAPADALLLIQGPLVFDWRRPRLGVVPRLENGCIQGSQPARIERLELWLKARVQVPARPDWFFVKLHAHGATENSHEALLGAPMVRFHEDLARRAAAEPRFHYHYVTAREMYNLVKAAEAGWTGSVADARDYELLWNGAEAARSEPEASAKVSLHLP